MLVAVFDSNLTDKKFSHVFLLWFNSNALRVVNVWGCGSIVYAPQLFLDLKTRSVSNPIPSRRTLDTSSCFVLLRSAVWSPMAFLLLGIHILRLLQMLPASVRVADNMVQMFFDGDVTDVSDWIFEFDLIMPQDIFESVCSSMKVDGCTLITTGVYFKAVQLHAS